MKFSIVVPMFNAERYIERCVTSLLTQNYPAEDYEMILVDNGSTDRSAQLARLHPRVQVLREGKRGSYAARNTGAAVAKGESLAFLDADCAAGPDWLRTLAAKLQDPELLAIQGSRCFPAANALLAVFSTYEKEKAAFVFASSRTEIRYGFTSNLTVRRSVFEELGGFVDIPRGADVVFLQRFLDRYSPSAVQFCGEASVTHLETANLWEWCRKMFLYGRSYRDYSKICGARALRSADRMVLLRKVLAVHRRSPGWIASLSVMLAAGLSYEFGRSGLTDLVRARLNRR